MRMLEGSRYSRANRVVPSAQNLPRSTRGFTIRLEVRVSVIVPQILVYFFCACCTPSQTRGRRSSDCPASIPGTIKSANKPQKSRGIWCCVETALLITAALNAFPVNPGVRDRSSELDLYQLWSRLFFQSELAVELRHAEILLVPRVVRFVPLGPCPQLFLASIFCDTKLFEIMLGLIGHNLVFQHQVMLGAAEFHILAAGENFVPAMLFVPLGQSRGHMHLLNDLAPTYTGVVSAKRDFTLLRRIRDDALLGPAKIIVE